MRTDQLSILTAFTLAAVAAGCAETQRTQPAAAAPARTDDTAARLRAALASAHRSEKNRVRDPHRHPFETLTFFGLRDDMTVVELAPGGGWYTEVLAPVLKDRGKLIVTSFDPKGPAEAYNTKRAVELAALLEKNKELFGN